ncbi:MAG: SRPBCC domain-containing protein [Filimonas sp.]|nr:SRPBCC domain-containing protein [Filimonas sp.]
MANTYDWSTFTKRIDVKCAIQQAYDAWTTQDALEQWFLRSAVFHTAEGKPVERTTPVQANDTYLWHWHGYDDATSERGKIVAANGKDYVCFTFCSEAAQTDMQVSVTIKTEVDSTIIELKQFNIPTDERGKVSFHIGCTEGWVLYLANLKSILEGGVDLRNKNEALKRMINS